LRTITYDSRTNQTISRDFNGILEGLIVSLQRFIVQHGRALKLESVQCGWKGPVD
jgi:hypothetical protein